MTDLSVLGRCSHHCSDCYILIYCDCRSPLQLWLGHWTPDFTSPQKSGLEPLRASSCLPYFSTPLFSQKAIDSLQEWQTLGSNPFAARLLLGTASWQKSFSLTMYIAHSRVYVRIPGDGLLFCLSSPTSRHSITGAPGASCSAFSLCRTVDLDHLGKKKKTAGVGAMAPHSSTLAWKIPWTEEPGRLQSMGSRRVGHDWATSLSLFTFIHWRRKWQPTPVFLPGESQGRRSLVGCPLWGRTESDTTEVT